MEDVEAYDATTFTIAPENFLHAVKFRRSIRSYQDKPMEREKLARIVDAGTGICRIPEETAERKKLDLLLTHLHLDHLMGLPLCPFVLKPDRKMTLLRMGLITVDAIGHLPLYRYCHDLKDGKISNIR